MKHFLKSFDFGMKVLIGAIGAGLPWLLIVILIYAIIGG